MWFYALILLLIVWAVSAPIMPYGRRRGWGYYPFGILSAILIGVLIFWWVGLIAMTA